MARGAMPGLVWLAKIKDEFGAVPASLIAAALVLGGGGVAYGLKNFLVQILALAFLLIFFERFLKFRRVDSGALMALCGLTLALPIGQLVPLPPEIWRSLPGREMAAFSRELVGSGETWFPLTLARHATVTAVFSLVPPLAILILYLGRSRSTGEGGLLVLVMAGVANFLLGSLQVMGIDGLEIYPAVSEGRLHGFFANHNSSGLFFVICLGGALGLLASATSNRWERVGLIGSALLFVLGTLLTNSRSSTTLLIIPLFYGVIISIPYLQKIPRKIRFVGVITIFSTVLAVGGLFVSSGRVAGTFERFENLDDSRPQIWQDTVAGVERYWPVGSGIGTFDEVFQVEESLENLMSLKAGRAHNDYLEVALETGLVGPVLILAWFLYISICLWRLKHSSHRYVANAAAIGLLCIMLQSTLDYPLRNQTLLCVAALLIGVIVACKRSIEEKVIE